MPEQLSEQNEEITVAIVEDHKEISKSLSLLIDNAKGFKSVGAFANYKTAMSRLESVSPRVVITDINLPDGSGIDIVRNLKPKMKSADFVMLTMYDDNELVFEALKVGATGYLLKRTPPQKILEAILEVVNGGSPMSMEIARKVVNHFKVEKKSKSLQQQLTEREWEILGYLSKGLRYKEIADSLFISVETVRSHLRKVYEKLQVRNATEAVLKYLNE